MIAKETTIVAGDVTDDARKWLEQHGARIEGSLGLLIITVPKTAMVDHGNRGWDYGISFYNAMGNEEQSWIDVELDIDVYQTSLRLKYSADPHCVCHRRGCAECNEELARMERGEDPYAHHRQTFKVGEIVAITSGEYKGQLGTIAGKEYEDPGNLERVCLVHLQGDTGPDTVVGIAEMESVKAKKKQGEAV